jgi:signal peptidase I
MTKKQVEKNIISGNPKVDAVYHNLEWVVTALAGTLVFIVFVMQVYRIPTGSMAETLRGSHFRLRCEQCGHRYDYEFYPRAFGLGENIVPRQNLPIIPAEPRCPSCGHYEDTGLRSKIDGRIYTSEGKPGPTRAVSRGDQIFVLKCIYQFFEPKRWDVVVFKNPVEPAINYIKRLIALPGEKVEIIDGDVYINDEIARKPRHVQDEMWMCVYDNDYQPARPGQARFNRHVWKQPFENVDGAAWMLNADGPAVFSLDGGSQDSIQELRYNPAIGNDFRATYAYDASKGYEGLPICSDLMLRYYVKMKSDSGAGVKLSKYGISYESMVTDAGTMQICRFDNGNRKVLVEGFISEADKVGVQVLQFANVDHRLVFDYGQSKLEYDLGADKFGAGMDRLSLPGAAIAGYGKLQIRHIQLMRDIHYISEPTYLTNPKYGVMRAFEGSPLELRSDEFFVCGDNSPNSYDARLWREPTKANPGQSYRQGIVPRDYLVGKAFFIHFPGNWRFEKESWRKIPYLDGAPEPDGIKIIYGGH